ncbi:hypothetical protein JXL19_02580 [bacterium]|nr:hypothetical protein [bacterium]
MNKGYRSTAILCVIISALALFLTGVCNAQVIWPSAYGVPPIAAFNTLPIGISYAPIALGSLPPIYPYVGDTITAFDSFVWPAGAQVPATSLAAISYAVPGIYSGYPGLVDPQIYMSTSWPLYIDYMNLYFTASPLGSTLPGAFGPFGLDSVSTYAGLAVTYPYYNYGDIQQLLTYYALNPYSVSYITSYPLIY